MPRVLVTPTLLRNLPGEYADILRQGGFEVVYPPDDCDTMQRENLLGLLAGADAMLASVEPLTREVLAQTKLRAIARMGVGFDAIDTQAATDLGIAVTITPGTLEESVAEHTVALMLGVTRGLVQRDREVRAGRWSRKAMPRIAGKTFGIVGLGRIGRAVVPKVQGLGMKVIAYDPFADEEFARQFGITLVTLDVLLATADVVSLHPPTTPETRNLINRDTLAKMKRDAVLINTARGAVLDEAALCEALDRGHLFGVGLDVFKTEPLPLDSPLLKYDNLLLCTHMGGMDYESQRATSCLAAQCLVDLFSGRWPEQCVVNRQLSGRYKW
ncbi:MAG: phosphoglycerate dehydrogenase [Pirellulaceae bacterium]|nr:phosphoglycerate dehydrogenase [Pirellulaceae bacterium]